MGCYERRPVTSWRRNPLGVIAEHRIPRTRAGVIVGGARSASSNSMRPSSRLRPTAAARLRMGSVRFAPLKATF